MITASHLYSYLVCPHRVTMDAHGDPAERDEPNVFVKLLWERGSLFERETVAKISTAFTDLSTLTGDEKERATRDAMDRGDALIYGGRLSDAELLGEPDLLRREAKSAEGKALYAAVDIKSGRGKEGGAEEASEEDADTGKPKEHYGVQLALYTDLLARLGRSAGRYGFIWDIHGREVRYDMDAPFGTRPPKALWPIYLETRRKVGEALASAHTTRAAATSNCGLCVWRTACHRALKAAKDLTLLPEVGRARRDSLVKEFPTLDDLAGANIERYIDGKDTPFDRIGEIMLRRFHARAKLAVSNNPRPYLKQPVALPAAAREIFFDIETDPMRDVCYLHGFLIREHGDNATERFVSFFAEDVSPAAERDAFARAWEFLKSTEGAVFVYSKYERTIYKRLAAKFGIATEAEVVALLSQPRTTDLYFEVVLPKTEWPTMSYSIKPIAKWLGFAWREANASGAASIEWFHRYIETRDAAVKQRILDYNEDDCRAMRVLVDALKGLEVRQD